MKTVSLDMVCQATFDVTLVGDGHSTLGNDVINEEQSSSTIIQLFMDITMWNTFQLSEIQWRTCFIHFMIHLDENLVSYLYYNAASLIPEIEIEYLSLLHFITKTIVQF